MGAQRVVQPDVAARDHEAGEPDVVVRQEDHAPSSACAAREVDHVADQRFAGFVGGVRLACEDELQRTLVVREQRLEARAIVQEQRGALVGRETTPEAHRQ